MLPADLVPGTPIAIKSYFIPDYCGLGLSLQTHSFLAVQDLTTKLTDLFWNASKQFSTLYTSPSCPRLPCRRLHLEQLTDFSQYMYYSVKILGYVYRPHWFPTKLGSSPNSIIVELYSPFAMFLGPLIRKPKTTLHRYSLSFQGYNPTLLQLGLFPSKDCPIPHRKLICIVSLVLELLIKFIAKI